jgi:hypothetical protein
MFLLHDPETFFRSYLACREVLHQIITQTPLLSEFDLAADNWDDFLPHDLATGIVYKSRLDKNDHMGVSSQLAIPRRRIRLTIWVKAIYSEPKALLLACKDATAAQCQLMVSPECSVCMEELPSKDNTDTVVLPCWHAFHSRCLGPWFHKVSTCSMCRRDMGLLYTA